MEKKVVALAVASALSLSFALRAEASAFALHEQGVSGLGNAYAGAAAVAEDASTVWWNPAGMSRLPRGKHLLVGLHFIDPNTRFKNNGSTPAAASNPSLVGDGGDAGMTASVPNLFWAMDLGPAWSFGLGINVPFGLMTQYDDPNWIGRFQGIMSEVKSVNVNPAVSFRLGAAASVGLGVSYQRADIDLLSAVNYSGIAAGVSPALLTAIGGPGREGRNSSSVDGDAWGWNVGALLEIFRGTRIGVHYRSSLDYHAEGSTSFTSVPAAFAGVPALAAATSNGNVKLDFETPASASVSTMQKLGERFELLADATWTQWSKIKSLPLVRTSGAASGQVLDTLTFNFEDTWRVSVGANYRPGGALTLRAGVAWDESPVPNERDRTVRLPDNDRIWLSVGATLRLGAASRLDAGYTFIQVKDADINNDQSARARGIVRGTYEGTVNILSFSYQHSF
jgi:long-chain fatty acid transport protein